jgi:hypothetical protein
MARQFRWHEKLRRRKSEGGAGIHFPHTPFFFPPRPSGKVFCSAARSAAIKIQSPDFRQKNVRILSKRYR